MILNSLRLGSVFGEDFTSLKDNPNIKIFSNCIVGSIYGGEKWWMENGGVCLVMKHLMLTIEPKVRLTVIYDPVSRGRVSYQVVTPSSFLLEPIVAKNITILTSKLFLDRDV